MPTQIKSIRQSLLSSAEIIQFNWTQRSPIRRGGRAGADADEQRNETNHQTRRPSESRRIGLVSAVCSLQCHSPLTYHSLDPSPRTRYAAAPNSHGRPASAPCYRIASHFETNETPNLIKPSIPRGLLQGKARPVIHSSSACNPRTSALLSNAHTRPSTTTGSASGSSNQIQRNPRPRLVVLVAVAGSAQGSIYDAKPHQT